jgi:hypothetical protein
MTKVLAIGFVAICLFCYLISLGDCLRHGGDVVTHDGNHQSYTTCEWS